MFSVKLFCSTLACALAAHYAQANTCPGHARPSTWTYKDQASWPAQSCRLGRRQSPVDIRWHTEEVQVDWDGDVIAARIKFDDYGLFDATVQNDGHTVHVAPVNDTPSFSLLHGGPLGNRQYRFSNFHFHWFSEHVFDGDRFPLEVHIVHHRADLTAEAALNEPDGYAVIAVFFRESKLGCGALDDLAHSVQAVRKPLTSVCQGLFDLESLLPKRRDKYFTYKGSLTTPSCNESVTWILMENTQGINRKQLASFFKVDVGSRFNHRQVQPLNGRTIYASRPFYNLWPSKSNANTIHNDYYREKDYDIDYDY